MAERLWRSTCPHCGAPVELLSAATAVAVCSFCRSTLAREGETLRRLGQSAELFDDHSTLQIGASGRWNDRAFTIIGRLQWRTADAVWNEWLLLFDETHRAWLSEDNGRYVMAVDAAVPAEASSGAGGTTGGAGAMRESLLTWQPGRKVSLGGRDWTVASVVSARIGAAEGELTQVPSLDERVTVVDLRDPAGRVATLAASGRELSWSVGQSIELAALTLTGLRTEITRQTKTRGVECPSCGTALEIKLEATKSIACHQCKSVVDLSKGVGADLDHYKQARVGDALSQPLIPLGSTGALTLGGAKASWQVVGYMVRYEIPAEGDDQEPPWTEYLLYSREVGFAFLVNASEGWTWAVPITGVPQLAGVRATWAGRSYKKRYDYQSKVGFVLGEFYWQVRRDQRSLHTDYASDSWRLNREQQGQEVTWSDGQRMPAHTVLNAFGIKSPGGRGQDDVQPLASAGSWTAGRVVMLMVLIFVIIALLSMCSRDRCDSLRQSYGASSVEYQQCLRSSSGSSGGRVGGGSWGGGSSSSGGHK